LIDFEAENVVDIPVAQGGVRYAEPRATTRENYNPFAEGYTDCVENKSASQIATSMKGRINEFDIASTIGGFDTMPTDETEFDYVESGESQNLIMDFEESREKPRAISLCGNRYAVATFSTKTLIIDLVRANEQILYKHYLSLLQGATAASQQLLFPEELTLTEEEFDLIEEYAVDFAALGFDIKAKEGATIEVFGIPANISMEMMDKAIYDIVQSLKLPQSAVDARRENIAQTLSHSEAVHRTNFVEEEIERIVNNLLDNNEYYTPQGKQIMLTLTSEEIKTRLG
jgi:DNA mismatch repair protein MutL